MVTVRRVYTSLLTLIWFAFVFGTVTYAGFNIFNINSIDGMWLTASAGDELEISIDGITFANELTSSQLIELFGDIKLIDVTTMDGKSFYTGGLRPTQPAIPNEHYLTFEIWFRTTQIERHIYLVNNVNHLVTFDSQSEGTYVVSAGVFWISNHRFLNGPTAEDMVERGQEGIYYSADTVRIGIEELTNDLNPLDERDPLELRTIIYDPSEDSLRGYGLHYGAFSYFMANTGYTNFRLPTQKPPTLYGLTQFHRFDPYQATDNDSLVAELVPNGEFDDEGKPYYVGKIRVNIWVEGWDADAFDAVANDKIRMQLQFKAAKPYKEIG